VPANALFLWEVKYDPRHGRKEVTLCVGIGYRHRFGHCNDIDLHQGKGSSDDGTVSVAIDQNTNKILAVGSEAKRMLGRTPGNVIAVRPLQSGVIANYTMTEAMIRHFLKKIMSGVIGCYGIA